MTRSNDKFENADELDGVDVDIRNDTYDEVDLCDFPCSLKYLPAGTFRDVIEQTPPTDAKICVVFPMKPYAQELQEMVTINTSKLFRAFPPASTVRREDLTIMQRKAIALTLYPKQRILYICGKAGCGKTEVSVVSLTVNFYRIISCVVPVLAHCWLSLLYLSCICP